ncbi:hypothetical protein [Sulfuricurvum sp.]|uniref:hypothetical protein n=1 Tax=Sulfuricurvum sp. TaxID=2025608 RepID=UPI003569C2E1
MSIIPISPDKVLTHKCDNGDEIYFRYLTGEYRAKYQDVQDSLYVKAKTFKEEAEKLSKTTIKNMGKENESIDDATKRVIIPTLEQLTAKKSLELAKEKGIITGADEDRHMAEVIDLFCTGWKIEGQPNRDPGKRPSEYFQITSMVELMGILSEHIEELMGLTVQDQKN